MSFALQIAKLVQHVVLLSTGFLSRLLRLFAAAQGNFSPGPSAGPAIRWDGLMGGLHLHGVSTVVFAAYPLPLTGLLPPAFAF